MGNLPRSCRPWHPETGWSLYFPDQMVASSSELQSKILRRCSTPGEYKLYRAALEWDLADPIVIESRKDFKSEYRWRDRLEPYHHQVTNLITFCRRLPVTLLADDVGLGKTISAGLVASELISRARIQRILVVCPKLLGPQWVEELKSKFSIPAQIATGRSLIDAEPEEVGAVITTYHSARLYLDKIPEDRFQMLVLDEAHKLRNLYGVDPPPKVAVKFRKALEERRFPYVLMLTATPIQNRLWDLYSLVDLLTVARGHQNPFGSAGMFARNFIADNREQARQLKADARDKFRSIVYGYMSRVRRGDAKLYFPDRVVRMHRVEPTEAELDLIKAIAKPIQTLNRLAQIGILQALTSSPHALMAQLNNMARNGTIPHELAATVRAIVTPMRTSAKLQGLATLVKNLKREQGDAWRMVVFTGRRETQTTIEAFLEQEGISVGIISGESGQRNQETIRQFWQNPPGCRVIVSTEAGAEGVNLQVANVLVNYDLPWNPMIVEQRIGRIQRLASEHASVSILNIILRGTFEECIVGRLMEKLQMASHAIGDIEALLEASGIADDEEKGAVSFDEKIRELVVAALAGKDVETATKQALKSIAEAKAELEREEANINEMLGSMDGAEYVGPRTPKLPAVTRTMDARVFTMGALESLGARVALHSPGVYLVEQEGSREFIRFDPQFDSGPIRTSLYAPGSATFSRLVDRMTATGIHQVMDTDNDPSARAEEIARRWVSGFNAKPLGHTIEQVRRCFKGTAIVRVRATVAHDSYERLVAVTCATRDHSEEVGQAGLSHMPDVMENFRSIGVNLDQLAQEAEKDSGIAEFCRFYMERRVQEMDSAAGDSRARKKLEDEFTPRLTKTLVALEGTLHREIKLRVRYQIDSVSDYESLIVVRPRSGELLDEPEFEHCASTGITAPAECMARCEMTGARVLRHRLVTSELTGRFALPEHTLFCNLTAKRLLVDEAELSAVTGLPVAKSLLKTSAISGMRAEPQHFGKCEFTGVEALLSELAVSMASGKKYRDDEQTRSSVSGKTGHRQEFIQCHETRQPLLPDEAEQCEVTRKHVRQGVLERCTVSGKTVLPDQLERSAVSGNKALKKFVVTSSLSDTRMLESEAVRSAFGKNCAPVEARPCSWSGRQCHPDDLRTCALTGAIVHFEYMCPDERQWLRPLAELLQGSRRTSDGNVLWDNISVKAASALNGRRSRVESASLSPDGRHLAVCCEVRSMFGLKVQHAGLIYCNDDFSIRGRIALGKRIRQSWSEAQ